MQMSEWAEREKVNRSRASRSLLGCISLGIDLGCVTEGFPICDGAQPKMLLTSEGFVHASLPSG